MITVFGATGNTGGAAAAHLLGQGKKVRAVGRHSDKLAGLVKAGAEAAVGDVEDRGFVRKALSGAEAAYVLIPPNLATEDFRAYQRRVADNLASGIEAAGVRHVVLLSSIGAHHRAGTGPIVALHELEERLGKLGSLNALFVRAGFFMQNTLMGLHSIKSQGIYTGPMPADAAVAMIAAGDIGSYAGGRLASLDFSGKSVIHLMGPKAVSQADVVRILGQAIGKPVRYVQVSFDDMEKGMGQAGLPASVVSVYMEMARAAGQGLVAPEGGKPIETCPTAFETFAKEVFAPAFRAAGG